MTGFGFFLFWKTAVLENPRPKAWRWIPREHKITYMTAEEDKRGQMTELFYWLTVWKINFVVLSAMKLIRFSHYSSAKSYHLCNFLNSLDFLLSGTFCAAQCHSRFVHRLWQREYIFSPEQTALSCSFPHCEADTTQIKMCLKLVLEVLCLRTDLSAIHYNFITNKKGGTSSTFPVYASHNWNLQQYHYNTI